MSRIMSEEPTSKKKHEIGARQHQPSVVSCVLLLLLPLWLFKWPHGLFSD